MAKGGKTKRTAKVAAYDFSFGTKRKLKTQKREWVLANGENFFGELNRLRDKIDWDALRGASNVAGVNAALSAVDQYARDRFPHPAVILATVLDPDYPKLRPIRFLADSCALAVTYHDSGDEYSPRYSRDICYKERKRRGPVPKAITDLQYWLEQSKLGQKVPPRYLGRINKLERGQEARAKAQTINPHLTYVDIPEKMNGVKKKRTTVWLPETTVAKLKNLSVATGAPMAELFRRAVEAFLKNS